MFDFLLVPDNLVNTFVNIIGFVSAIEFIGCMFLLIGSLKK